MRTYYGDGVYQCKNTYCEIGP